MDAFAVSVTNGMTIHKIKLKQAGVIALTYGVFRNNAELLDMLWGLVFRIYGISLAGLL